MSCVIMNEYIWTKPNVSCLGEESKIELRFFDGNYYIECILLKFFLLCVVIGFVGFCLGCGYIAISISLYCLLSFTIDVFGIVGVCLGCGSIAISASPFCQISVTDDVISILGLSLGCGSMATSTTDRLIAVTRTTMKSSLRERLHRQSPQSLNNHAGLKSMFARANFYPTPKLETVSAIHEIV